MGERLLAQAEETFVLVPPSRGVRPYGQADREFQQTYGREPSLAERFYIAQQAMHATRARTSHEGETGAQQLARWTEQRGEVVRGGLGQVAQDVFARAQRASETSTWSPRDIAAREPAGVAETKQVWSRSALMRGRLGRAAGQPAHRPGPHPATARRAH